MNIKRKTASIIIIGNEILSGRTLDTNSNFMAKELVKRGVDVNDINIIKDNKNAIVDKIKEKKDKYEFIFTTGGIGPTHDDITVESIGEALNIKLEENKLAKDLLSIHYEKNELNKSRLKMAILPKNSKLIKNPVSLAPGFYLKNIYVFPGVPKIMQVMFLEFINNFFEENNLPQKQISTILPEGVIAEYIEIIQKKNPEIDIGSYPYFKNHNFGVSLILKSQNKKKLDEISMKIFEYLDGIKGKPKLF